MMETSVKVFPHKDLELVLTQADGVFSLEGSLSFPLPRCMTVFKLPSGKLWISSAVALSDYKQLDDIGEVGVIYVPNGFHRLDAKVYKERYPEAVVVCPGFCRESVEQILSVEETVGPNNAQDYEACVGQVWNGTVPDCFEGVIQPIIPAGAKRPIELVFQLTTPTGATVLSMTDTLFHLVKHEHESFLGRHVFDSYGPLHVTRFGKWFMIGSRKEMANWLTALATGSIIAVPDAITVAHGDYLSSQSACKRALEAAAWNVENVGMNGSTAIGIALSIIAGIGYGIYRLFV